MRRQNFWWVASMATVLLLVFTPGCSSESRMARHLERADMFFEAGRYDAAEIEYVNALQLDRSNARAIAQLGLIYFDQGRASQARAYLLKAIELDPDNTDARVKAGFIDLAIGRVGEARAAAEHVLESAPAHPEAPLLLAETVRTESDAETARALLAELSGQGGDRVAVMLAQGMILTRSGELDEAESVFKQVLTIDPESAAAHFALGNLYLARNNLEEAEAALKRGAELSPWRSVGRLRYAEFKVRSGDTESAKQVLREITKEARDYLPAWNQLAEIALAEKDFEECESLIKQCLNRDPNNYEAMMVEGRLRLAQGDRTKALAVMERAAGLYGRSPVVHHQLALAHLLNDDSASALRSVNQALGLAPDYEQAILLEAQLNLRRGDHAAAIARLGPLVERNPRLIQAQLMLANAYRMRGSLDDAAAVYRRVEELFPTNPQAPLLRGVLLVQQEKRAEARAAFRKSLESRADYLPALGQLVNVDLVEKRFGEAGELVQAELAKRPDSHELHLLRAKVLLAQERTDEAEAALLRAIELEPGYTAAYLTLARLYVDSKQNEKALARLRELLEKNPEDTVALMLSGMIHSEMGDHASARKNYERLLEANPRFSPALNNLAYLYSEHFNELDKAHEMARKARELLPYDPHTADTLGWILFQRGDYQRALGLLQESAEKMPQQPEVQYHLGMTLYMLGNENRAATALRIAAESDEAFPGKEQAERCLEVLAMDGRTIGSREVALLERRLKEVPHDPAAVARLAAHLEHRGDPGEAAKVYERALEQNRRNPVLLSRLAQLYHSRLNDDARAMELAREAYGLAPDDVEVSRMLGRLVFEAGDHRWAVSLLERGVRAGRPEPGRLYELGVAYHSVGRVEDAQRTLRSALERGSNFPGREQAEQFLNLIRLAADPARAVQSRQVIDEALTSDPANSAALMAAGVIAEQRGDYRGAEENYSRLLKRYPAFAPAGRALALLWGRHLNDQEKAYEFGVKAREAFPGDPEVARALGIASYSRGDYRRSAPLLREASRAFEGDGETAFYLGMSLYQLKDLPGARQFLTKAVELSDSAAYVGEAQRVLAELN